MRRLLYRLARNRFNMWAEAYGLALAMLPRWHPQVTRCEENYFKWRDRKERWK